MSAGRSDPYLDYRFLVEVDSLIVGGFSEVSGLSVSVQTKSYQEGGVNAYTHTLPTRFEHDPLVLKRGLVDDTEFWEWTQAAINDPPGEGPSRRTVRVFLHDSIGQESWGWQCRDALPVQWTGPDLDASDGAVAIETIELAHRGLSRIDGLP